MTDHYATAVDADRLAMNSAREASRKWHRKAQVHAVLALAEQQRIANLIALAKTGYGRIIADEVGTLDDEIVHALRIETP